MDLVEYVTAWTLGRTGVASLIMGSRDEKQLDGTLAAIDKTIPAEHLPQIDALFSPAQASGRRTGAVVAREAGLGARGPRGLIRQPIRDRFYVACGRPFDPHSPYGARHLLPLIYITIYK